MGLAWAERAGELDGPNGRADWTDRQIGRADESDWTDGRTGRADERSGRTGGRNDGGADWTDELDRRTDGLPVRTERADGTDLADGLDG